MMKEQRVYNFSNRPRRSEPGRPRQTSDDFNLTEAHQFEEEIKNAPPISSGEGGIDPMTVYLKEINSYPLLKSHQEIELARKIKLGKEMVDVFMPADKTAKNRVGLRSLLISLGRDAYQSMTEPHKYESTLREAVESIDALTNSNLRLVISVAKRYLGRGLSMLDLVQEGNSGLIRAVEKYDGDRGFRFSTYGSWWIRQAIVRAVADQGRLIRIPVHTQEAMAVANRLVNLKQNEKGRDLTPQEIEDALAETSLSQNDKNAYYAEANLRFAPLSLDQELSNYENDHVLAERVPDPGVNVSEEVTNKSAREEIQKLFYLVKLTENERKVLIRRFGLDGKEAKTLEAVGEEFKVSRERIRQIEVAAMTKLRNSSVMGQLRSLYEES